MPVDTVKTTMQVTGKFSAVVDKVKGKKRRKGRKSLLMMDVFLSMSPQQWNEKRWANCLYSDWMFEEFTWCSPTCCFVVIDNLYHWSSRSDRTTCSLQWIPCRSICYIRRPLSVVLYLQLLERKDPQARYSIGRVGATCALGILFFGNQRHLFQFHSSLQSVQAVLPDTN